MAGYEDTRQKIISTLMGRPNGTEIQPENHQDYALNMLDYIRSLELIATSTLIGVAESNTTPVQPDSSRVCYIAGVAQNQTVVFENFIDENGNPISVTTGDMEGVFIILLWNTQYWSAQTFSTNIISHSESATFYYRYNIRKTYASIALMNDDVASPIGTDGKYIKVGDIVTVVNSTTPSENGIYSYTGSGWQYQSSFNFQLSQELGNDPNIGMSQKIITERLNGELFNTNLNTYISSQNLGLVMPNSSFYFNNKEDIYASAIKNDGGYLNQFNEVVISSLYEYTDYIACSFMFIELNVNVYEYTVAFYDNSKRFITMIGIWSASGGILKNQNKVPVPVGAYYCRINRNKNINLSAYGIIRANVRQINDTFVGQQQIAKLGVAQRELINQPNIERAFIINTIEPGYINANGSISINSTVGVSDYIEILPNTMYFMPTAFDVTVAPGLMYDENKVILGVPQYVLSNDGYYIFYTNNVNAKYIRLTSIWGIPVEVYKGIPTRYGINKATFGDLLPAIQSLINGVVTTLFSVVNPDTGALENNNATKVTDFVPIVPNRILTVFEIDTLIWVCAFYDKDKNYISGWSVNNVTDGYVKTSKRIPENAYYARFNISNTRPLYVFYDDCFMDYSPRSIVGIEGINVDENNINLVDGLTFTNRYYLNATGTPTGFASFSYTNEYIPIIGGKTYIKYPNAMYSGVWYDADKNVIGYFGVVETQENLWTPQKFIAPTNAAFARLNCNIDYQNDIMFYEDYIRKITIPELVLPQDTNTNTYWNGKRIAWYGTSIPAGYPYQNNRTKYSYANRCAAMLGANILNYCVPNGCIRKKKHDGTDMSGGRNNLSFTNPETSTINYQTNMLNLIGTTNEPDLFVFDYGVNDIDADNWELTQPIDYSSQDVNLFYGACNFVIAQLLAAKPRARVIIVTHFSDDGAQPGTAYNGKDVWEKMNEIIRGIAEYWGIPCIDLCHKTGWYNIGSQENIHTFCPDGIHPATDPTLQSVDILTQLCYGEISNLG